MGIGGGCGRSGIGTAMSRSCSRDEARRLLADGVDPSAHRKIGEQAKAETFEAIAREWLEMRAKTSATITMQKARWLLEMIFPRIGKRPIREVTAPELAFSAAED
jgi:hypothetical protein